MARIGVTFVLIAVAVCAAVAVMVVFLAMHAATSLWLVLPVAGILAGMGAFLGFVAWRASRPRAGD